MKSIFTILFLTLVYSSSFSQRQEKIFYDKDWKVCLEEKASFYRLVKFSKKNKPIGLVKDYIDTLDSRKDVHRNGIVSYYYINGNKSSTGKIIEGKNNKKWVYYYRNGVVKTSGNYINNEYNGRWKKYDEEGRITDIIDYKKGLIHGKFKIYTIDNFLNENMTYSDGIRNGKYKKYSPITGKLVTKGRIIKDKKEGSWVYYHPNGQLGAKGFFKNNLKTGFWEYYYINKQISAKGKYKEGKKAGEWGYYYKNGVYLPPFRYQDNPNQTGEWRFR